MTRWGIAGTGGIATAFAAALRDVEGAEIVAIGSRDRAKAERFTKALFHTDAPLAWAGQTYGTYENLMADPNVEVVYVGTPASHHYRHALAALNAGKHCLVEKPFTVNAAQANILRTLADASDLFLMEAMWCRFLPAYVELGHLLDEGEIGEVRGVEAAFGGRAEYDPKAMPFRPDLAGGTLLHGGCYPVQFAHLVFRGDPWGIAAEASFAPSGVDTETAAVLRYPGGQLASCRSSILTTLDNSAWIYGTDGMISIPAPHINPAGIDVHWPGKESLHIDTLPTLDRLAYQAIEVQRCLAEGLTVSPSMTPVESCAIMGTLDRVREAIGLRYPADVEAL